MASTHFGQCLQSIKLQYPAVHITDLHILIIISIENFSDISLQFTFKNRYCPNRWHTVNVDIAVPVTRLTTAHHAHGKNRVVWHLWVSIVGKLAECVQDVQTRVGHRNESQGQGHRSPQGGLTIPQLMIQIQRKQESSRWCTCTAMTVIFDAYLRCHTSEKGSGYAVILVWFIKDFRMSQNRVTNDSRVKTEEGNRRGVGSKIGMK